MFKKLREKVNNKLVSAQLAVEGVVANKKGEGYVDSGVKILIAVVVGAILLTALVALFKEIIMPSVTSKINDMFSTT